MFRFKILKRLKLKYYFITKHLFCNVNILNAIFFTVKYQVKIKVKMERLFNIKCKIRFNKKYHVT